MADAPFRVQPALDDDTTFFWTSGEDGRLRIARCRACGYWLHPPAPYCPACGGRDIGPEVASGRGTIWSFTVNHHSWDGGTEPYVIVLVELDEQPGLRLTSNLVDVPVDEVRIGTPVEVVFEERDGIWYPLFRPVDPS